MTELLVKVKKNKKALSNEKKRLKLYLRTGIMLWSRRR